MGGGRLKKKLAVVVLFAFVVTCEFDSHILFNIIQLRCLYGGVFDWSSSV